MNFTAYLKFRSGLRYCKKGDYFRSGQVILGLSEIDPCNVSLLTELGKIYFYLGKLKQASSYLSKALAFTPESELVNCSLGFIYLHLYRFEDAKACFIKVLLKNVKFSVAWLGLGKYFCFLGQLDDAIKCTQIAISFDSSVGLFWEYLGELFFKAGKRVEVVKSLKVAFKKGSRSFFLFNTLLNNLKNSRDKKRFFRAFKAVVKADVNYLMEAYNLVLLLLNKGDNLRARDLLLKLISVNPYIRALWDKLRYVYNSLGDSKNADKCRKKIISFFY